MIKFFRRIRKNLLEANSINKYLLYATGEIILVVIGILIALQINNWNEERKDSRYEQKMLKELRVAIENDIDYTTNHILGYRTRETEKSLAFFKRLLKNESVDMDSIERYLNWTTYGVTYQVNEGPYQAIKSAGLDKISNDSLRNFMQWVYDFRIPRNGQLIKWNEDANDEKQQLLKDNFFENTNFEEVNGEIRFKKNLVKGKFWFDPKFIDLLQKTEFRVDWRRRHFEALIRDLKNLKSKIDKELKEKVK